MTACPGPCNAHRADGEGEPVPGEPVWCRTDQARIRRQFCELDILGALRAFTADGHREQATEPSRGNGYAPSPSPAMDTVDELTRWVFGWEDAYRDLHPRWAAAATRRGYLAEARTEAIAWLAERMDGVLAAPFAADFGRETAWWHRYLLTTTKAGSGRKIGAVPCPVAHCRMKTLFSADGGFVFWCASCGRPVRKDEYDELCRAATPVKHAVP